MRSSREEIRIRASRLSCLACRGWWGGDVLSCLTWPTSELRLRARVVLMLGLGSPYLLVGLGCGAGAEIGARAGLAWATIFAAPSARTWT